jgi:hypothetical protein
MAVLFGRGCRNGGNYTLVPDTRVCVVVEFILCYLSFAWFAHAHSAHTDSVLTMNVER